MGPSTPGATSFGTWGYRDSALQALVVWILAPQVPLRSVPGVIEIAPSRRWLRCRYNRLEGDISITGGAERSGTLGQASTTHAPGGRYLGFISLSDQREKRKNLKFGERYEIM